MNFENIEALHQYIIATCQQLHYNDLDLIFISGSIARGTATAYSDIDYTATVSNEFSHPAFKFLVVKLEGIPRIVSIFFYKTSQINITSEQMDAEHYLWEKQMLQKGRSTFVYGNEKLFEDLLKFYQDATYKHSPNPKLIHKSTGKLLELIVKVRKYFDNNDIKQMLYYGMKIAEHSKRLVLEANLPLSLSSESEMLHAITNIQERPKSFENLYCKVARITKHSTTAKTYLINSFQLVQNTLFFVQNSPRLNERFTKELFETPIFTLLGHVMNNIV